MDNCCSGHPGTSMAVRDLYFFWIVDVSGSMGGQAIGAVNHAIGSALPEMIESAQANSDARLMVRTLAFSHGANWVESQAVPIEQYSWQDLETEGVTDMGAAFEKLADFFDSSLPARSLPPVLVLITDGLPTDNYREGLDRLNSTEWGGKAIKIAITIGTDLDLKVFLEFTGREDLVLNAGDPTALVANIRWASTTAGKVMSNTPLKP